MQRRGVDDHRRRDGSRRRPLHLSLFAFGACRHARVRRALATTLALVATPHAGLGATGADDGAGAPLRFEAAAIADLLHADKPALTDAFGHLGVRWSGDADRLFGWPATTFRVEAIADGGGKPNRRIGTVQGVSNIEVRDAAVRLYGVWLQHELGAEASVLVGLYDLNSEFYATEASALLIHPAFGTGAELGQTGRNGPSIFPVLSFGTRLAWQAADGRYAQAAVLAATSGDPAHPDRTVVRISRKEGAILVGEAGWRASVDGAQLADHWGVGVWAYSERVPRSDDGEKARDFGAYLLGQVLLRNAGERRVALFARAGTAAPDANLIDRAIDAGVLVQRAEHDAGPRAWSAGIAVARLRIPPLLAAQATGREPQRRYEVAFEVDARWQLGAQLAVQPLAQYVSHPGGRSGANAALVGVRWLWSFPGDRAVP